MIPIKRLQRELENLSMCLYTSQIQEVPNKIYSIEEILLNVCNYFGITPDQLKTKCREVNFVIPKHIFCYLASVFTYGYTLKEIASYTDLINHASVLHAKNKLINIIHSKGYAYDDYTKPLNEIKNKLGIN